MNATRDEWLVLNKSVSAIVHELPYTPLPKSANDSLPLKVLVVRSSPEGLQVKVPPAGPICNQIILLGDSLGSNVIHVDLLSSEVTSLEPDKTWDEFEAIHLPDLRVEAQEAGDIEEKKEASKWREFRQYLLGRKIESLEPATWDQCRKYLKENSTNYHILLYLGHGNHIALYGAGSKVGVLQFEKPGGKNVDPVSSRQLKEVLQNRQVPIPLVLLAGCLTAAEVESLDAASKKIVEEGRSEWTLGSQGVAQALVDSASGVQCAVGMRFQIETNAAFSFLRQFFESLLKTVPGNVEAAVREGRSELFALGESPPSWAAPVIFRTRGTEPSFRFIADIPKTHLLDRQDVRDQDVREAAWTALVLEPQYAFPNKLLETIENQIKDRVLAAKGALIIPEMKKGAPGEEVEVKISLFGSLSVRMLRCKLCVSCAPATIQAVEFEGTVKNRDFCLSDKTEIGASEIAFKISTSGGLYALVEGVLLIATVKLGSASPAKYVMKLNVLETEPQQEVRTFNNVVLVLPD